MIAMTMKCNAAPVDQHDNHGPGALLGLAPPDSSVEAGVALQVRQVDIHRAGDHLAPQ